MTRTYDNVSQGNAKPSHHGIPEGNNDRALFVQSEQERHAPVQDYHRYMGGGKTFDSSNDSVYSGYQTKDLSQCQIMSKEPHATSRLGDDPGVEKDAAKASFLSHGAEKEIKCSHRQRVVKSKRIRICMSMSFVMLQEGYTIEANTKRHHAVNNNDLNRTLNIWHSKNIAAHLYANITSLPEKLTWTTDVGFGSAFLSGLTLTQESRIMVPHAGYYFIYSAVTFKCQHNSKTHIHLINKQKKSLPKRGIEELLLSKSSVCGSDGFYTSFLSGVLHLTNKDEISVNLTDDSLSSVYASSLSNFFGVYVI